MKHPISPLMKPLAHPELRLEYIHDRKGIFVSKELVIDLNDYPEEDRPKLAVTAREQRQWFINGKNAYYGIEKFIVIGYIKFIDIGYIHLRDVYLFYPVGLVGWLRRLVAWGTYRTRQAIWLAVQFVFGYLWSKRD